MLNHHLNKTEERPLVCASLKRSINTLNMLDPTESRMLKSVNQTFTKGGHASALLNGDFTFKLIECMAFQQAHFTLSLTK